MILVFIFLGTFILISIISLILMLSTIKIKIENLNLSSYKKENRQIQNSIRTIFTKQNKNIQIKFK